MVLVVLFFTFATAIAEMRDTRPSLSRLLNTTEKGSVREYLSLLRCHPDFFDLLSSPPDIFSPADLTQNDITLLIPSNNAFGKIPFSSLDTAFKTNDTDTIRSVLEYHVLSGVHTAASFNSSFSFSPTWLQNSTYSNVTNGQVVGGVQQSPGVNIFTSGLGSRSTLSTPDLEYTNGLVHIIDTFLIPPVDLLPTTAQLNITAFAGALAQANLLQLASTTPDITVFCPTDAAFAALGSNLEAMPQHDLEDLLRYHLVVPSNSSHTGPAYSPNLSNGSLLSTILSQPGNKTSQITVIAASNSLFVNSARIIQLDVLLANGVLHVIDNVLSPNDTSARPAPSLPTQNPVLSGTPLSGGEVPFTTDLLASATAAQTSVPAGALTSSFGVGKIGESAPTATLNAVRSGSGAGGAAATTAGPVKSGAGRVTAVGGSLAAIVSSVVWGAIF